MNLSFPSPAAGLEVEPVFIDAVRREGAPPFRLIDCREEDEHAHCHIEGDVLVPLSRFVAEIAAALPGAEVPVVIYCHHGMRSAQAAGFLRSKGHALTFSLRGGIEAWSLEVDPSVARY
ncbi:MAG: adenylyltransferase and sulfurtransferase [Verrucomicrobia bacterium]|jgi:adenylyltransferase/sulfurtransferase|nr:MAG: adenylyltransferase and sulfurtransferase [Verrucomicrobiota bacterium]